MTSFTIERADGETAARAGVLRTAHGPVRTPAFVPLASHATVKGLLSDEVAALGYDMVLGNTFHLMLSPGEELIRRLGGLHRFMAWQRPIITDSGGFQVFSLGHGRVAEEIKGSRRGRERAALTDTQAPPSPHGAVLEIAEEGVRFRSYIDGRELCLTPERSMSVQAALGADVALAFDECTPFHVDRDYTRASTERTHRWLARCLQWHSEHAPAGQLLYGIAQGGVHEDLRRESTRRVAASGCDGVAIGGSLGASSEQMHEVVGFAVEELRGEHEALPRHLLGIGEIEDLIRGVELGIDTFDCAMPTRLGRHGSALVSQPPLGHGDGEGGGEGGGDGAGGRRWRIDLARAPSREDDRPLQAGCSCWACSQRLSRAYLSYLVRSRELTGARLLSAHNLAFIARLMGDLREAILAGTLAETAARWRAGRGFEA